jgi:hypothetical protein
MAFAWSFNTSRTLGTPCSYSLQILKVVKRYEDDAREYSLAITPVAHLIFQGSGM